MVDKDETFDIPEPTKEQSGAIKAIAKDTVHKICSGQVVLSLAIAVKELVENAIDAGATLVEVKLRNQGLDLLEVCDNGSGVEASNLEALTAKYHTSKIREFVDLQGVETFGFRGEALSSLCALSDMTIMTRHKSTDVGVKIQLDHTGKIKIRTPCARSIGTTVALTNLFATLPVRRRDFVRNIKKEFNKMCQILQAYCLVATGVRIICTNHTSKGGKTVVLKTHGAADVLANITAVFGSRQLADIMPLKSKSSAHESLTQESVQAELQGDDSMQVSSEDVERLNAEQFQLEGYVSSCSHGAGRSAKDRQYFYINSRPCDPKNIAKLMNEVYHRYNMQQYPFIYLNVSTPRNQVDVNLTPDKRQLLINNEKILLLAIKCALMRTYGNIPSTYKVQNSTITSMFRLDDKAIDLKTKVNANIAEGLDETADNEIPLSTTQKFIDVLSQWKHTGNTIGEPQHVPLKRKCSDEIAARNLKLKKIQDYLTREEKTSTTATYKSETESENDEVEHVNVEKRPRKDEKALPTENVNRSFNDSIIDIAKLNKQSLDYDTLTRNNDCNAASTSAEMVQRIECKVVKVPQTQTLNDCSLKSTATIITPAKDSDDEFLTNTPTQLLKTIQLDDTASDNESDQQRYASAEICTTLAEIELNVKAEENLIQEQRTKTRLERLRFKSEISPTQNQTAEAELQREITKQSFARMEIIGQFNLGFIIVKLDTDLFIVDQHATDEKYNFEMLQRTTVLQNQRLTVPQTLEMTAVNEMVLLDHMRVFEQNGFKFEINENAPPTKKVRLLGKPFSRNWEFGKDDIDELIFMLQDAPEGTVCRPSRIRAMFASRACRKSVMIGKALNRATMKLLITHMGEIEQPWNCPHGRPTMRHLINTAMLLDEEAETKENAT